jgi:hypothetical protein
MANVISSLEFAVSLDQQAARAACVDAAATLRRMAVQSRAAACVVRMFEISGEDACTDRTAWTGSPPQA